jgi:hypothetical protein
MPLKFFCRARCKSKLMELMMRKFFFIEDLCFMVLALNVSLHMILLMRWAVERNSPVLGQRYFHCRGIIRNGVQVDWTIDL